VTISEMPTEIMSAESASEGPFSATRSVSGTALLTDVRVGRHKNFDRVVFEFSAPIPGYTITYVPKVFQDGSGDPLPLRGRAFISAVFTPASAHDNAGHPTVPSSVSVKDFAMLRDVKLAGDFEAVVSWGIGLAAANGAQVTELTGPSRIVIDLAHAEPGVGNQLLRRGSHGAAVATWQWRLVQALHRDLRVDEDFGPITEKATRDFQAKRHITVDGIVGPQTRAEMRKTLGLPNSPPS
jgi:peptidoglycan hydrolase-like protein with peptidoglycan-binding domain